MSEKTYYSRKGLVSNSSLNYLEKSPELFRQFIMGEMPEETASYLEVGQLTHLKVLEPFEYDSSVVVFDYSAPKSAQQKAFIDAINECDKVDNDIILDCYRSVYTTKEVDEKVLEKANKLLETLDGYRRYLRASKFKTVIQSPLSESITRIENNARAHKKANELLFGVSTMLDDGKKAAFNEYEILWKWNDVKCKSLLDRIVVDYENKVIKLIDFKTTYNLNEFKNSYEKFHYDRQLAFYKLALKSAMKYLIHEDHKGEEYTIETYIVAADTKTEKVKVFIINDLVEPTQKVEELLSRAQWHIQNSKWDHSKEYYEGDGCEEL